MEFAILGPLEIRGDVGVIRMSGARSRALLVLLLLNRNEVVSSDRILNDVWPEHPPSSGRAAIQTRVAALRHVLGADRILTREPGYSLRVEVDELDSERFEHLVADGRRSLQAGDPASSEASFAAGLDLWHGEPLIDVAYAPFAQPEIQRLSDLRLAAIEDHVDARLALGRHAELVHELEGLVVRHPFRERLHGQLIIALYQAGRQADALAAFQVARRVLAEELGIEPGPDLQRLQQAVLAQDPALLAPATEAAATPREQRRTISVVLVEPEQGDDIDPELARRRREASSATATRIVERHGGRIQGFVGDRLVATFGLPVLHEDDALRAVRAGVALGRAARSPVRIAIATGEVVSGGQDIWDVTGPPLTDAERLLLASAPGDVVLGAHTEQLVRSSVRLHAIDGSPAWIVRDVVEGTSPATRETPFVGRRHELGQLLQTLARARDDRSMHLVTVIAPPGVGKSRLARQFASAVGADALVITGHCPAYGEGITFWPIAEMLDQVAPDGRLAQLLSGDDDAALIEARLGALLGSGDADVSVQEAFWAVRGLIEALGRERPIILIVEDIHWAEPTLLSLLEYLAGWTRDAAVMVLCLARPELLEKAPGWGGGRLNAVTMILDTLTRPESAALVGSIPVARQLAATVRARIEAAAEGNPLFIEQIVAHLAEHVASSSAIPIPPTIQALLAARIEQLTSGERSVLECASIVGREFATTAVTELLPAGAARADVSRHLRSLESKDFLGSTRVRLGADALYRFRHILLQQSAYLGMTKELRAELHERFADWLESSRGEASIDADELVGYHLEQAVRHRRDIGLEDGRTAGLADRAGTNLLAAGRRAFASGDMAAAAGVLRRATDLLPSTDHARLDCLPDLGVALFEVGRLEDSRTTLTEALELAREVGDERALWRATVQTGQVGLYIEPGQADIDRLFADANTAAGVLRRLGDPWGSARAWRSLSDLDLMRGRVAAAARACQRATDEATLVSSRRERAWSIGQTGFCWVWGPSRIPTVIDRLEALLGSSTGDPLVEANVLGFLALAEMMAGRSEDARRHMARGRAMTVDLGLIWQSGYHDTLAADMERVAGNPARAESFARSAMTIFLDQGDRWTASMASLDLAGALVTLGRTAEALEQIDAADVIRVPDDAEWWIKRHSVGGRALAQAGRVREGLALAEEAVAAASRTEFAHYHATALLGLAEVQALCGREDDALHSGNDARRRFLRKGDRSSAGLARRFAAELVGRGSAATGHPDPPVRSST